MKNLKIKILILISLLFLTACSSVKTVSKYEKKEKITCKGEAWSLVTTNEYSFAPGKPHT